MKVFSALYPDNNKLYSICLALMSQVGVLLIFIDLLQFMWMFPSMIIRKEQSVKVIAGTKHPLLFPRLWLNPDSQTILGNMKQFFVSWLLRFKGFFWASFFPISYNFCLSSAPDLTSRVTIIKFQLLKKPFKFYRDLISFQERSLNWSVLVRSLTESIMVSLY